MMAINNSVKMYLHAYKQWISSKPQVIADIESTIRFLSYLSGGQFSNSSFVSELIYSVPNLFVLVNDCLIYNTKYVHLQLPHYKSQIKIWLTIIEYIEALLEVSANKLWGNNGKWIIIFVIQSVKTILRLILVHRNKERIIYNPAIPVLNRDKLNEESQKDSVPKEGFQLKRSGVVIRSVNATGPYKLRTWAPLKSSSSSLNNNNSIECDNPIAKRNLLLAETLYIIKPLIHLTGLMVKGNKNWLPWITALAMDTTSLQLISRVSPNEFTKEERHEIFRRRIHLLLYIIRSPFYDKCSRTKIYSFIDIICNNVLFGRLIGESIAKYLPHWQQKYFYMWSC